MSDEDDVRPSRFDSPYDPRANTGLDYEIDSDLSDTRGDLIQQSMRRGEPESEDEEDNRHRRHLANPVPGDISEESSQADDEDDSINLHPYPQGSFPYVSGAEEDYDEEGEREEEEERSTAGQNTSEALVETFNSGVKEMEAMGLSDISNLASWTLSSYKSTNGIAALQDDSPLSFWQSDGPQPHNIDIHFSKRVSVERISFFTDYLVDESYTPSKVTVSTGTGYHDLMQLAYLEMDDARGWVHIPLNNIREDGVIKTFLIRFTIISNLQNGKDTHLRALKVYSPVEKNNSSKQLSGEIGFTSIAMLSESMVR